MTKISTIRVIPFHKQFWKWSRRDLSLPNNALVYGISSPKIRREVRLKKREVRLDPNFMARVLEKLISHSKELGLRMRVEEQ